MKIHFDKLYSIKDTGTEKLYIDNVSVVPEPATLLLLGAGGLVTAIRRRK